MTCEELRPVLAETLTGAAGADAGREHLASCSACKAYLEDLEKVEKRLKALPRQLSWTRRPSPRWPVAAAAAVFLCVLTLLLARSPSSAFDTREATRLAFPGGGSAELEPGSRGEWGRDGVRLLAGGGRFQGVDRLDTPAGRVRASGAEFLGRLSGDALAVSALAGRSQVDHDGRIFILEAGQEGLFGAQDPEAQPGQGPRYDRLLQRATVSLRQALPLAVAAAGGGTPVEAELDEEEGRPVWVVLLSSGEALKELVVDAAEGKALGAPKERKGRKAPPVAADLARAAEFALGAVPGTAVNAELEEEDGAPAASVRVFADGKVSKVWLSTRTWKVLKVAAWKRTLK